MHHGSLLGGSHYESIHALCLHLLECILGILFRCVASDSNTERGDSSIDPSKIPTLLQRASQILGLGLVSVGRYLNRIPVTLG